MTPVELKLLQNLAQQKRERDLAELLRARQSVAQTDRNLEVLEEKIFQGHTQTAQDLLVSAKWQGWAAQERLKLETTRSQQVNTAETARKSAAHSDAKTRVIGELLETALKDELQQTRRKAEQNGREPDK